MHNLYISIAVHIPSNDPYYRFYIEVLWNSGRPRTASSEWLPPSTTWCIGEFISISRSIESWEHKEEAGHPKKLTRYHLQSRDCPKIVIAEWGSFEVRLFNEYKSFVNNVKYRLILLVGIGRLDSRNCRRPLVTSIAICRHSVALSKWFIWSLPCTSTHFS